MKNTVTHSKAIKDWRSTGSKFIKITDAGHLQIIAGDHHGHVRYNFPKMSCSESRNKEKRKDIHAEDIYAEDSTEVEFFEIRLAHAVGNAEYDRMVSEGMDETKALHESDKITRKIWRKHGIKSIEDMSPIAIAFLICSPLYVYLVWELLSRGVELLGAMF